MITNRLLFTSIGSGVGLEFGFDTDERHRDDDKDDEAEEF